MSKTNPLSAADDARVLAEMKRLYLRGHAFARAGALAKRLGMDSVAALGAMLRMRPKYQRWINLRA